MCLARPCRVRDFYLEAIGRARIIAPQLPLMMGDSFRPTRWGTMLKDWPYENIFMDTHIYHGFNQADIASDNPKDDRMKLYVHERIACGYKAQLHFETCNSIPTLVGEFSLAIDNCMPYVDSRFKNFGQCDNLEERINSPWWDAHYKSFAMRQISTYERELGWSFWTYKLDEETERTQISALYWSFRLAFMKGYIDKSYFGLTDACIYEPAEDYSKGDLVYETSAPTMVPQTSPAPVMNVSTSNYSLIVLFALFGVATFFGYKSYSKVVTVGGKKNTYVKIATSCEDIPPTYQQVGFEIPTNTP